MGRPLVDITGRKFGRLTVVERVSAYRELPVKWRCRCECGNESIVAGERLKNGTTKSCGCLARETTARRLTKDITGKRYGKLTVVRETTRRSANGGIMWDCLCECGQTKILESGSLTRGSVKSCGCATEELFRDKVGKPLKAGSVWNNLTVIEPAEPPEGRTGLYYSCECTCGNRTIARASKIRDGRTKSCGCLKNKIRNLQYEYEAAMKRMEEELATACDNCGVDDVREENGFDGLVYDVCVDCGDVSPMREAETPANRRPKTTCARPPLAERVTEPVAGGRRLPWGAPR